MTIEELWNAADDDTKAGNYFVANYPPFSFWSPGEVKQVETVLEGSRGEVPLGLYFHIPFCRKRCHFCYFRVYTDKNAADISRYLDAGVAELDLYAKRPYMEGRLPKFVYFGGGTPSYLSAKQLTSLTDRLKERMSWDEAEEVTFECEPGTLTEDKLRVIRDIGVTRLSFGIENFSDHILEINGRAHRSKEVFRAYDFARSLNFPSINIDLIAGMVDENEENWKDCIEQTVELAPDCVTIYQMEVPFNTTIYKEMKENDKLTAPVANWATKRRWVNEAFQRLQAAGYTVTSAYTAVKDPEKTKFVYRDRLWAGADLLALGVASFSHLGGVHFQNQAHLEPYGESIEGGKLPIFRGLKITDEEKVIREFILQMKLGRVDLQTFDGKFGEKVTDVFSQQLGDMQRLGLAKIEGQWLVLTPEAMLRIDALLHAFFLPQHRNARYT